jgi:hypothetical protein
MSLAGAWERADANIPRGAIQLPWRRPSGPQGQLASPEPWSYNRPMDAPAIKVTCECGEFRSLPYGEQWKCETCGRRWNTEQIPAEEYRALSDAIKRYQRQSILFAAVMLAIFIPLVVIVDVRLGVTGLILFFAWALLVRPRQRRRLLDKVRSGPRWQLSPE